MQPATTKKASIGKKSPTTISARGCHCTSPCRARRASHRSRSCSHAGEAGVRRDPELGPVANDHEEATNRVEVVSATKQRTRHARRLEQPHRVVSRPSSDIRGELLGEQTSLRQSEEVGSATRRPRSRGTSYSISLRRHRTFASTPCRHLVLGLVGHVNRRTAHLEHLRARARKSQREVTTPVPRARRPRAACACAHSGSIGIRVRHQAHDRMQHLPDAQGRAPPASRGAHLRGHAMDASVAVDVGVIAARGAAQVRTDGGMAAGRLTSLS